MNSSEVREEVRKLLQEELRIQIKHEAEHGFISGLEITIYLGDEPIAFHADWMGWPKEKNGIT